MEKDKREEGKEIRVVGGGEMRDRSRKSDREGGGKVEEMRKESER